MGRWGRAADAGPSGRLLLWRSYTARLGHFTLSDTQGLLENLYRVCLQRSGRDERGAYYALMENRRPGRVQGGGPLRGAHAASVPGSDQSGQIASVEDPHAESPRLRFAAD